MRVEPSVPERKEGGREERSHCGRRAEGRREGVYEVNWEPELGVTVITEELELDARCCKDGEPDWRSPGKSIPMILLILAKTCPRTGGLLVSA